MYCPACGKENDENSKFCEFCGVQMSDNSKHSQNDKQETKVKKVTNKKTKVKKDTKRQEQKKVSKGKKICLIIICLIIIVLVALYFILADKYKPENTAKDYFLALMNEQADKLYQYVDVPDTEFTTKKVFKEVYDDEDNDLLNYSVASSNKSMDGLSATVVINYTLENSSKTLSKTINLVKDKQNKLIFFDNWKISNQESLVVENYKINIIKGASLSLEGIDVDAKYLKKSTSSYDTYVIPALFRGEYDARITLKNGLEFKDEVNVLESSYTDLTNFELKEQDEKNLEKTLTNVVESLYQSAIDKKQFSEIKQSYEYNDAKLDDLEKAYTNFEKSIESSGLTKIKVTDIDVENTTITKDGFLYVTVSAEYEYTLNYEFLGEEKTKTDDTEDLMYLTFDYSDGAYKLVDMSSMATYFSKY